MQKITEDSALRSVRDISESYRMRAGFFSHDLHIHDSIGPPQSRKTQNHKDTEPLHKRKKTLNHII